MPDARKLLQEINLGKDNAFGEMLCAIRIEQALAEAAGKLQAAVAELGEGAPLFDRARAALIETEALRDEAAAETLRLRETVKL